MSNENSISKTITYKSFEIYFSDLNADAQKRLLEFVGEEDPSDMNWDLDICPIAEFDIEVEEVKR